MIFSEAFNLQHWLFSFLSSDTDQGLSSACVIQNGPGFQETKLKSKTLPDALEMGSAMSTCPDANTEVKATLPKGSITGEHLLSGYDEHPIVSG